MLVVKVRTIIHPTEDKEKVIDAVKNIFDGEITLKKINDEHYELYGYSTSLESLKKLYSLVRSEQIISAVRSYMVRKTRGKKIVLMIHKQAAYVGKISLIDSDRESPLGAITITIEADNPEEIIDWIAPELSVHKPKKGKSRRRREHRKQMLKKTFK